MHDKEVPGNRDANGESAAKAKEGAMPHAHLAGNAPAMITTKSASFQQSKSFNKLKESKPPSSHESSKTAKPNGASSRREASAKVDNGGKASKLNGAGKSGDPAGAAKPKEKLENSKIDPPKAETLSLCRSERVKSPSNGSILKSSSSKLNIESLKKSSSPNPNVEDASHVEQKPALTHVKSLSPSLHADPQKKLPPIKTVRAGGRGKGALAKNTANLCAECKAELEGAVCFIGNDGRVSACTSRTAVRLCKNLKCANNNPEYVASVTAAIAAPKKYLVSRRHSFNVPPSSRKSSKGGTSDKTDTAQAPSDSSDVGAFPQNDGGENECQEFDMQGDLEEDDVKDMGEEEVEIDGIASASPQRGRANRFQWMRRRSFSVVEKQGPEVVTLKKQMIEDRKQAEEWMLDYAIEEALHKLAPSRDSKVKALVEAFESIMVPQKDAEAAQDQSEGPKTPSKIAVAQVRDDHPEGPKTPNKCSV